MNKWMTKKNVFIISAVYFLYFLVLLWVTIPCKSDWCEIREDGFLVSILYSLASLGVTFFLSLLTYKMRDEAFEAWISFAKWFVPVTVVATLLLGGGTSGGFAGVVSGWFNAMLIGALYLTLILVSLTKIIQVYARKK